MILYFSGNPTGRVKMNHLPETLGRRNSIMLTYELLKKNSEQKKNGLRN
jgi:hypothetical protein